MTHHYITKKTLKTKKLTQFLKEFNLPLSPSLGSMISSLGEDNYENWEEKVFVRFNTNQSIDSSWKVLFNLCDPNKLNKFTETLEVPCHYLCYGFFCQKEYFQQKIE